MKFVSWFLLLTTISANAGTITNRSGNRLEGKCVEFSSNQHCKKIEFFLDDQKISELAVINLVSDDDIVPDKPDYFSVTRSAWKNGFAKGMANGALYSLSIPVMMLFLGATSAMGPLMILPGTFIFVGVAGPTIVDLTIAPVKLGVYGVKSIRAKGLLQFKEGVKSLMSENDDELTLNNLSFNKLVRQLKRGNKIHKIAKH